MNCRSERYAVRLANREDGPQLRSIYESGESPGKISLTYTRGLDPYRSLMGEGEKTVIPVIVDLQQDRVCGMGACVIHKTTYNGAVVRAGYLTGLKSLPEYRNRIPGGRAAYQFLYENTRDSVDIFYTTILSGNFGVQHMLEKKRSNMPEYRYLGDYTVYVMGTGARQRCKADGKYRHYKFAVSSLAEVQRLFEANKLRYNLAPAEMKYPGIKDDACFSLSDREGNILAACAVWNRQDSKQNTVARYRGIYRIIRKLPFRFLGYPDLPKENQIIDQAYIALLTVLPLDPALAAYFVKKVASVTTSCQLLTLGFFENHPLNAAMSLIRTFQYRSRLYTVDWTADAPKLDGRPVHIEAALL